MLIVNEYSADGLLFLNGKDITTGKFYHWESLSVRPKGGEIRFLRKCIAGRLISVERKENIGILPIFGPLKHNNDFFLGWEKRNGLSLWNTYYQPGDEVRFLHDFRSLVFSYLVYHQQGIVVGQPVWERIYSDFRGIYFPDPAALFYLNKPESRIPVGLGACYPPELFHDHGTDQKGDIFFLGLLLYWSLTGKIPYSLIRGWPTQAIVKGETIPLLIRRPDIDVTLSSLVDQMLAHNPEQRPTMGEIEQKWCEMLKQVTLQSSSSILAFNLQQQKKYHWNRRMKLLVRKWQLYLLGLTLLLVIGFVCLELKWHSPKPILKPLRIAQDFYKDMVVSTNPNIFYKPEMVRDFSTEREQRFVISREILTQPLVKLEQIKIIKQKPQYIILEADLTKWCWKTTGWVRLKQHDYLVLRHQGQNWRIESRKINFLSTP